jgi:hypothetical protein
MQFCWVVMDLSAGLTSPPECELPPEFLPSVCAAVLPSSDAGSKKTSLASEPPMSIATRQLTSCASWCGSAMLGLDWGAAPAQARGVSAVECQRMIWSACCTHAGDVHDRIGGIMSGFSKRDAYVLTVLIGSCLDDAGLTGAYVRHAAGAMCMHSRSWSANSEAAQICMAVVCCAECCYCLMLAESVDCNVFSMIDCATSGKKCSMWSRKSLVDLLAAVWRRGMLLFNA